MDLYKVKNSKLEQLETVDFALERDIQILIENNCSEIFDLQFVKSEFTIQNYRIDTLCFDQENNSFVIIEYKRNHSYSVIDQGFTYLSTMLNNKADFVLEYNESTGENIKRDQVDWTQSRVIFISQSFSSYQKDSVNFKDIPFELWEVKQYKEGLIGLNQLSSNSKESIKGIQKSQEAVLKEVEVIDEDSHFSNTTQEVRELYQELKDKISEWNNAVFKSKNNYISISKGNKVKIYLIPQKKQLKIHLLRRIDFKGNVKNASISFQIDDPKNLFELKSSSHKEIYEHILVDQKNLNYVLIILKQKFDS